MLRARKILSKRFLQRLEVHQGTGKSPKVQSQSPKVIRDGENADGSRYSGRYSNRWREVGYWLSSSSRMKYQSAGRNEGTNQYEKIINQGLSTIYHAKKNPSALKKPHQKRRERKTHRKEYMASNNQRERDNQCIVPSLDLPPKRHHIGDHHGNARKAIWWRTT